MRCTDANSALRILVGLAMALFATTGVARAHPQIWVTMKSEVIYAPDGSVIGIRHAWSFDDMFSTYALQGIEHKKNGVYTREELAPLAEANINSFKDFNYFNYARIDGQKREDAFDEPVGYSLDYAILFSRCISPCHSNHPYVRAISRSTSMTRNISSISVLTRRSRSSSSMRPRDARLRSSDRVIRPRRSSVSTNPSRHPRRLPGWDHILPARSL